MSELMNIVNEQAEDEGLWFVAQTAPEAYLQQELRRLHAAIEAIESDGDPHQPLDCGDEDCSIHGTPASHGLTAIFDGHDHQWRDTGIADVMACAACGITRSGPQHLDGEAQ